MIISDLQYVESVENSEIQGGYYWESNAYADGFADARGKYADASTYTFAVAGPGYATAYSNSNASASGYYY